MKTDPEFPQPHKLNPLVKYLLEEIAEFTKTRFGTAAGNIR